MTPRLPLLLLLTAALTFAACDDDAPGDTEPADTPTEIADDAPEDDEVGPEDAEVDTAPPPTGDGIFAEGCPVPGRSTVRQMNHPDARLEGPDAIGGPGDYVLMNERAAFVVVAPGRKRTYWYYDGILVDAVALDGCAQAGAERFEELVPLLGKLDTGAFEQSVLRGFRAERFEILADGSDGEAAVLRVHGVDDTFWLIDHELARFSFLAGNPAGLSEPLGVSLALDYILEPSSSVLRVELHITNTLDTNQNIIAGAALWYGDTTRPFALASSDLEIGGFGLRTDVPYLISESHARDGAIAFTLPNASAGTLTISGVRGFIDVKQVLIAPPFLGPAGGDKDTHTQTYLVAVGPTDANSATRHLQPLNPTPIPNLRATLQPLEGTITRADDGAPIPGAVVDVQLRANNAWQVLDSLSADDSGRFQGFVHRLGAEDRLHRLVARAPGHASSAPFETALPTVSPVALTLEPPATLSWSITDGEGAGLPAKILLWQGGRVAHRLYADGTEGSAPLPAGDYEVTVTRGMEHAPHSESITLTAGQESTLSAALPRVVDTSGFLSTDPHIHAGPSSDSDVLIEDRARSYAAEGLDVLIATDHEYVSDWNPGIERAGLSDFITAISGQEVTATIPEHSNMYPVVQDFTDDDRGGPVPWYARDIDQLYQDIRARGAGVVQLNHPRQGCNYLCLIDYDRVTGAPTLTDPTVLGLPEGSALWTWDFDAIEYQNGHHPVFIDPDRPRETGHFEDWMSFHNLGHPVTAVGVTDVHGLDAKGSPRTFFVAPTDDPTAFLPEQLTEAFNAGRVLVSTGAFARVTANTEATLGDTLTDTDGAIDLDIHVEALPEIDVTEVRVYLNCDHVLTLPTDDPAALVKLDTTTSLPVTDDAHLVVLGFGQGLLPQGLPQFDPTNVPRFTTNPIFIDADGDGAFTPPGGKLCDLGP